MKKIILIIILLILVFSCTGKNQEIKNEYRRFVVIYEQKSDFDFDKYFGIVEDTETNVLYLIVDIGYGVGITKLERRGE